eukprot:gene858-4132_t
MERYKLDLAQAPSPCMNLHLGNDDSTPKPGTIQWVEEQRQQLDANPTNQHWDENED